MKDQTYANHVRFHPLFHFFLFPLTFLLFIASIFDLFTAFRGGIELWFAVALVLLTLSLMLAVLLTRTYANKVQDRVIRAEENFRHFVLSGRGLDPALTTGQILALRFASDEEYLQLCAQAVQEHMSADQIKRAVKVWRADHARV